MVAVYDRGAETREAFRACWARVALFEDFRRMLEEVRPDLLCVATRQTQHATQIQAGGGGGGAGGAVRQAPGDEHGGGEGLLGACRETGVPLAFGLDRRWSARYRARGRPSRRAAGAGGDGGGLGAAQLDQPRLPPVRRGPGPGG